MTEVDISDEKLVSRAREVREDAYAWRSDFQVGAALEVSGVVHTGVNIEVSGMSTSIHAEMMAFYNAVYRFGPEKVAEDANRIAVSCEDEGGHVPCMLCLHTMSEFVDDITILTDDGDGYSEYSLKDQYVDAYRPGDHD